MQELVQQEMHEEVVDAKRRKGQFRVYDIPRVELYANYPSE